MKTVHALIASLIFAFVPAMGCTASTDEVDDGADAEWALAGENAQCNAKPLEVIVKGRENRFGIDGQQVALNAAIPIDRICQQVATSCRQTCTTAKAEAVATGIRGFQDTDPVKLRQMGELADNFNAALGLETNFKALGGDAAGDDEGAEAGGGAAVQCNAKVLQVLVKGQEHRFGFDGRQVALNAAIPMQNICERVSSGCRATCDAAKAAAQATGIRGFTGPTDAAKLGQMGQLADTFNAALGNQTDFKSNAINLN
jgi:hypothetical protein